MKTITEQAQRWRRFLDRLIVSSVTTVILGFACAAIDQNRAAELCLVALILQGCAYVAGDQRWWTLINQIERHESHRGKR